MGALNFHHLRYFWAVAHAGRLSQAASELNVSASAVSVQLRQLEEALGHALFDRQGKQLVLTEAGRVVLDHADAIFALGDELVGSLGARGQSARTVLRVGALATLSRNFQREFLAPLLGRADVEFVLRSGAMADLLRQLEAHRLDVVLANVTPPQDAATPWVVHTMAEQPVSLVGRPDRRRPGDDLRTVLGREPLVVPALESSIRLRFEALVARLGIAPTLAAEVDDMAMLRVLAREDIGATVVPSIVVRDELQAGALVELAALPELSETFVAITSRRRFPNPLLRELLPG